jgi:hypothetical protein
LKLFLVTVSLFKGKWGNLRGIVGNEWEGKYFEIINIKLELVR